MIKINPKEIIANGYGEFAVFSMQVGKQEISQADFEKVYAIFCRYAPGCITVAQEYANRFDLLHNAVKAIDPHFEIAFIPRTLYELFLINKSIKEDKKRGKNCPLLNPKYHKNHFETKIKRLLKSIGKKQTEIAKLQQEYDQIPTDLKKRKFITEDISNLQIEIEISKGRITKTEEKTKHVLNNPKCWHRAYFEGHGSLQENQDENVKIIAYRLNRSIAKRCAAFGGPLSYQKITEYAEKELDFLKQYYREPYSFENCNFPGPTTSFKTDNSRGLIRPMGIRNEGDANIIRNAIALECKQNAIILYRGASPTSDVPYDKTNPEEPFSLSFGTGLFSGVMFDQGATPYGFMHDFAWKEQAGYALLIEIDRFNNSIFYIPRSNTICQLSGKGEHFHARTVVSQDTFERVKGVQDANSTEYLRSTFSQKELNSEFEEFKKRAIVLT